MVLPSIEVLNGGTGYASTDPPVINIENTTTPGVAGSFYPVIVGGAIKSISIVASGSGYFPLPTPVTAVGKAELNEAGQVSRNQYCRCWSWIYNCSNYYDLKSI